MPLRQLVNLLMAFLDVVPDVLKQGGLLLLPKGTNLRIKCIGTLGHVQGGTLLYQSTFR